MIVKRRQEMSMLISKAKFVEIIAFLNKGPASFNGIRSNLGVSPATLTRRLSEMEKYKLVESRIIENKRKRIKYVLTEKGKKVAELVNEIRVISQQINNIVFSMENLDS